MAERSRNTNENPCHMCMPMGGILAMKGVAEAMVIVHGSQGCSTYMRRHIAEHFNEPVDVGSSSLNEKGTVYGGEVQLKQAIDNVRRVYKPEIIGIVTTCLAETIGEDVRRTADGYLKSRPDDALRLVTASTPGYGDSYTEGWQVMVKSLVSQLAQPTERHGGLNIITAPLSPADIRELKRLLAEMRIEYTLLPDYSETLDRPYASDYAKLPAGGTRAEAIANMSGARATIMLGWTGRDELSAGRWLEANYGVPCFELPLPIGLENCDRLLDCLSSVAGVPVPKRLAGERGRLLDAMVDSHKYNFAGRAVVFGDPDWVYATTTLCLENGILPLAAATGSRTARLAARLGDRLDKERETCQVISGADFAMIRALAEEGGANLAIGPSEGRVLEEKCGIPLVRLGFPIHDRVGGQRQLSLGYAGTTQLLDRITNTLLEHKHKHYRSKMAAAFYRPEACATE